MVARKDAELLVELANDYVSDLLDSVVKTAENVVRTGSDPSKGLPEDYLNCSRLLTHYKLPTRQVFSITKAILEKYNDKEFLYNIQSRIESLSINRYDKDTILAVLAEQDFTFMLESFSPTPELVTKGLSSIWDKYVQYVSSLVKKVVVAIDEIDSAHKEYLSSQAQKELVIGSGVKLLQELNKEKTIEFFLEEKQFKFTDRVTSTDPSYLVVS